MQLSEHEEALLSAYRAMTPTQQSAVWQLVEILRDVQPVPGPPFLLTPASPA